MDASPGEPSASRASEGVTFANALCAIDGSAESLLAVAKAGALVGPGGHLTLLIATSFRHDGEIRSPAIQPWRASEIVEGARQAANDARVSATVEVDPDGAPGEAILRWSAGHDLLALGAAASASWFGAVFMDSVTAVAEEELSTSLLVARGEGAAPRRIVIASDGLDGSDGLVELGAALAAQHDADVTLVHVLGPESRAHPHRMEGQAAQLALARPGRSEARIELGTPRNVIVEVAGEARADLVVMSSRRLSGLRTVGSVSRPVVAHAPCSVLLVPPELLAASRAARA
ncbi:MAG TPA: universal stress protein [Solirubrobacteraceae bacterium]|nr:universal stress protein [Solirubrobacteraceae bacterium]